MSLYPLGQSNLKKVRHEKQKLAGATSYKSSFGRSTSDTSEPSLLSPRPTIWFAPRFGGETVKEKEFRECGIVASASLRSVPHPRHFIFLIKPPTHHADDDYSIDRS